MNASDPVTDPVDGTAPPGFRLASFELQNVVRRDRAHVVYRAWDHALRIPVAIKEYCPAALARRRSDGVVEPLEGTPPDAFRRGLDDFVEEARLLARCDHPSLVRVMHLLRLHGTAYRVMPWHAGRPLLQLRRDRRDPPDEATLRGLLSALLGALETFHRVGGVHGGVDPSRILLDDEGRTLLLGPVRSRSADGSDRGHDRGTGPWSDFFALSRVARFLITGLWPPAPDEPAPEPLLATVEKLYFDAPQVRYSERLLHALDAAASPAIDERPRTAAEFRQWIEEGRSADSPRPQPAPAAAAAAAAAAAISDDSVDPATVDLIRRVLESIPERSEPPAPAMMLADAPALDLPDPPLPLPPRRGRSLGQRLLAVGALGGVAAAIAWSWPWWSSAPARRSMPASQAAAASPEAAPAVATPPAAGLLKATTEPDRGPPQPTSTVSTATSAPAAAAPVAPAPVARAPLAPAPVARAPVVPPVAAAPVMRAPAVPGPVPPVPVATPARSESASTRATGRAQSGDPRQVCGARSQFALYRCMEQQCARPRWKQHAQCVRFRTTDRVG